MTIQPSVTIWTILCFLALMWILDRLLFRPILGLLDKRREKIDGAAAAKASALRQREEELRRREEDRIAAEKRALQAASAALEEARRESAGRAAEKKAANARELAARREALGAESRAILDTLDGRTAELSAALVERLDSWRHGEDAPSGLDEVAAPYAEPVPNAADHSDK